MHGKPRYGMGKQATAQKRGSIGKACLSPTSHSPNCLYLEIPKVKLILPVLYVNCWMGRVDNENMLVVKMKPT